MFLTHSFEVNRRKYEFTAVCAFLCSDWCSHQEEVPQVKRAGEGETSHRLHPRGRPRLERGVL